MEMGKFLWEGREKSLPCWLSQFSVLLENAKKNLVFHFVVGRHASFPQKPVLIETSYCHIRANQFCVVELESPQLSLLYLTVIDKLNFSVCA